MQIEAATFVCGKWDRAGTAQLCPGLGLFLVLCTDWKGLLRSQSPAHRFRCRWMSRKTFSWNVNWVKMCVFCKQSEKYLCNVDGGNHMCFLACHGSWGKAERGRAEQKKYCQSKWKAFGQMRCGRGGSRGCSGWVMVTTTPDSRLIEMSMYWQKTKRKKRKTLPGAWFADNAARPLGSVSGIALDTQPDKRSQIRLPLQSMRLSELWINSVN